MTPNGMSFEQSVGNIANPFKNNGWESKNKLRVSAIKELAKSLNIDISSIQKINGNTSVANPLINNSNIKELISKDTLNSEELGNLNSLIQEEVRTLVENLDKLNNIAKPEKETNVKSEAENVLQEFMKEKLGEDKYKELSKEDLKDLAQKAGIKSMDSIKKGASFSWNATKKIGKGIAIGGKIIKGTFSYGVPALVVGVVAMSAFNHIGSEAKLESEGLNAFLNSQQANILLSNGDEQVKVESVLAKEGADILVDGIDYGTGNGKLETLFSDYDNFGMNETTITSYANLSTTDIESLLTSENNKAKEEFTKVTVDLKNYVKENREYHNGSVVYNGDIGEAEVKRMYAREYYNHITNVTKWGNTKLIKNSELQLENIKNITKAINLKSTSDEINFRQITISKGNNPTISTNKVSVKLAGEKTLIKYGE